MGAYVRQLNSACQIAPPEPACRTDPPAPVSGPYTAGVAVRRPDLAGHLQPLGRVGQIHAVAANLRYPASVEAAARDADIVINLVGILFEAGRQRFESVHAFGAEAVALAAAVFGPASCLGAFPTPPARAHG
jgi:NADH dehydrogenase